MILAIIAAATLQLSSRVPSGEAFLIVRTVNRALP